MVDDFVEDAMSYLTSSYDRLKENLIEALEGEGFPFNPLTTDWTAYLATALGQPDANLRKSEGQLLSELDASYGGSLSHLRASIAQLLDDLEANIDGDDGGGEEEDDFMQADVDVTSAQLKTLHSAPMKIIDAPGVGFAIMVMTASFSYRHVSAAYANVTGPNLYTVGADTGASFNCFSGIDTIMQGTSSKNAQGSNSLGTDPIALMENQAVYFADESDATTGNGTAKLSVTYAIVPV